MLAKFFGVTFGQLTQKIIGGALGVLGLLIGGMTESYLGSRMSPLFWVQVGMVVALQRKEGDI